MTVEKKKNMTLIGTYIILTLTSIPLTIIKTTRTYGIAIIAYLIFDISYLIITTKKRRKMLKEMGMEDKRQNYKEIKKLYKEFKKNEKSRKNT